MSFVVSARKYRPARFEEVVGQRSVATTLKNAIKNDKLAQSFLFCGPRGVGKTTCARILAKIINCRNLSEDTEPCGTCEACQSFEKSASFNIFELDAASNNSVDDIRKLIEQVRFAPQSGKYKIYIIDEVHMLSQAAFNAFLKTLEEPPSYAVFILATTEKHKIIPTILSRCQIFDFNRIKNDDIIKHLEFICADQNIEADTEALQVIAQKADGALRDALSIFDRIASFTNGKIAYKEVIDTLNILDYDYYFKVTDALLAQSRSQVLLLFDEILQKGFEGDNFINGLAGHFRNLLVCKEPSTLRLLEVSGSIRDRYQQQSTMASSSLLLSALSIAGQCDVQYKMAKNKRLQVELALLKMCFFQQTIDLSKLPIAVAATAPKPTQVAATNTPKTPAKPVSQQETIQQLKSKTVSIGSLNALQSETKEKKKNLDLVPKKPVVPLTATLLADLWKKYTPQISSDMVKSVFTSVQPTFDTSQNLIKIVVTSKVQKGLLVDERMKLMTFLREATNNEELDIQINIDKTKAPQVATIPYKPSEKLNAMTENNPKITDLIDRIDMKVIH